MSRRTPASSLRRNRDHLCRIDYNRNGHNDIRTFPLLKATFAPAVIARNDDSIVGESALELGGTEHLKCPSLCIVRWKHD